MRRVPSTGEPWRHQARAAAAVVDARVVERFQQKVVIVPGSECLWWVGGISGRGHGRKRAILRQMQHSVAHRGQLALIAVSHCGAHLERES